MEVGVKQKMPGYQWVWVNLWRQCVLVGFARIYGKLLRGVPICMGLGEVIFWSIGRREVMGKLANW